MLAALSIKEKQHLRLKNLLAERDFEIEVMPNRSVGTSELPVSMALFS